MAASLRPLPALVALALLIGPAAGQDRKPPRVESIPLEGLDKPLKKNGPDTVEIIDLLAKRVSVDKFEGEFGDAVQVLRDRYDLPLVIDPSLKRHLADTELDQVQLPPLRGVRADTVLRLVGDQVEAVFLVEPDHIRLVHSMNALIEAGVWTFDPADPFGGEESPLAMTDQRKYQPAIRRALVSASFKGRPLSEILGAIAESTGANVVLAPQAAEQGKLPLTARFANTPVDAAVRTLCEMTDLGVIEDANVLVVTTPERAAVRAKAAAEKRRARLAEQSAVLGGGGLGLGGMGFGGAGLGGPPDLSAEITQLKEQNAELKKQLDEIQKLLRK